MEVNSCYAWDEKSNRRNNNKLFPKSIRGLIVGKSGCGKTTLLLNLILKPDWLDYDHLYVFGKSLHQKEYKILKAGFEKGLSKDQITNIFENQEVFHKEGINPVEAIDAIEEAIDEVESGVAQTTLTLAAVTLALLN